MATPGEPTPPPVQLQPGQQPTPEQIETIQAHMRADAERLGLTWEQYVTKLREMAMRQQQAMMQQQQAQQAAQGGHVHGPNCNHGPNGHAHGAQQQLQVPPGGPPKPEALAMANFLRGQPLKLRTCVFNEKKADMFRVKRAIRVLEGDAYKKARAKNPLLPEVKDRASAEVALKLLPMSLLALRVQKVEPDSDDEEEKDEAKSKKQKKKRIKGQWAVQIVQQQDTEDDMYYMWLYDGPAWKQQAKAVAALAAVMTIILFPLWPLKLRQGAWYLSMGFFGLIVCFFVMAIFRLILFIITMFSHPPGLWLFPNLFEDVGFIDSFIPLWAWQTVSFEFQLSTPNDKLTTNCRTKSQLERRSASNVRKRLQRKPKRLQKLPVRQVV
jgi:translocation protein SEC62